VEQVWLEPETVDFVHLRLQIIAEDFALAQAALDKLSREFIMQNELIYLIATDYLALDDIEAALEILDLDPELDDAKPFIGQYYLQQEQYQKSLDYLQEMIASSDKAEESLYLIASVAAQKLQKNDLALEILQAGLAVYPDSSNLLNSLGYTIADLELTAQFAEAEKYLLQAVQLEPESSMIWDSLAWLYYRQGRYQEALEILSEHFSQDVQNSEIAYHLGAVHLKMGNLEKAKKYLIQTLILQNNEQAVQAAEKLLQEHFQSKEAHLK
jgi:tetratricopeptide (TPR) repeat protein